MLTKEQYYAKMMQKAGFAKSSAAQQAASWNQYQFNQSGGSSGKDYGVKADPSGSGKLVSKATGNTITNNTWSTNSSAAQGSIGAGLVGPIGGYTTIGVGQDYGPSNGYGSTVRFGSAGQSYQGMYLDVGGTQYALGDSVMRDAGVGKMTTLYSSDGKSISVRIKPQSDRDGRLVILGSGLGGAKIVSGVQQANAQQQTNGGNMATTGLIKRSLDPYQNGDIQAYLQANPMVKGLSIGGTYHKNQYYNPNATGQAAELSRLGLAGHPDNGPYYWYEGTAAPASTNGGGAPAPVVSHGGGGGGGGGSSSAPSAEGFGPREPLTHQIVQSGPTAETTQGQLVEVLDEGGPIMRRAVTRGMQLANDRGLINSSIAEGAAMGAVMEQAVPIAMSDANTHFTNSMNNLNAQNQFRAANNAAYLESILQEQQGAIQERLAHISGSYGIQNANIAAQASYMDMWLRMQMDPYLSGDMKANLDARVNPYISRPIYV